MRAWFKVAPIVFQARGEMVSKWPARGVMLICTSALGGGVVRLITMGSEFHRLLVFSER
jgi:hypothetical protein